MIPFNDEVKLLFKPIDREQLKETYALNELNSKLELLVGYKNNALIFYIDQLFIFNFNNRNYIVFGHEIGGYFILDEVTGRVYWLYLASDKDSDVSLMFCNSTVNQFICFNNLFFSVVDKVMFDSVQEDKVSSDEDIFYTIEKYYKECDPASMGETFEGQECYWPTRTYELSDGFYPLTEAHIEFYATLINKGVNGKSGN
ncbi:hypothetical protein CHU32_19280 [Superficieibacter electus]|uniref:Uncharacterized protein n=2 Tax=Superficieibacter electus TaxID=2022662 RepID=A0A2P5GLE9_9ENTR|nr:hypothetical protein CHU33_18905 [Superficieibacter electus]POP45785.1 hypothetical protein CHU32_19280 [Superficieibacter electus]